MYCGCNTWDVASIIRTAERGALLSVPTVIYIIVEDEAGLGNPILLRTEGRDWPMT